MSMVMMSLLIKVKITALHDCNDCGIRGTCKFSPRPGQAVRINCPLWVAAGTSYSRNGV